MVTKKRARGLISGESGVNEALLPASISSYQFGRPGTSQVDAWRNPEELVSSGLVAWLLPLSANFYTALWLNCGARQMWKHC